MKEKKIHWIIEKDLFPEYESTLVDEIKKSGNIPILYDHIHGDSDIDLLHKINKQIKDKNPPVIFHGSLQLGRRLDRISPYYPTIYLTIDNYECYKYYGYYGNKLFNEDYLMMGLNDVLRNVNKIKEFAWDKSIFIRPSNGFKSFTGQILHLDSFKQEYDTLVQSYGGLDMDQLVVIANDDESNIKEEYRVVIINGEPITASMYMDKNNIKTYKPYWDKNMDHNTPLFEYTKTIINNYNPDKGFVVDIVLANDDNYYLLEINSLCCASLYGCDIKKIVTAMNKTVLEDYYDTYTQS